MIASALAIMQGKGALRTVCTRIASRFQGDTALRLICCGGNPGVSTRTVTAPACVAALTAATTRP